MKIPRFAAPLFLAGLFVAAPSGCASSSMPGADELLAGAHRSLELNDTATAHQWLQSAQPRLESARQTKEFELLTAELDLRTGSADLALPAADHLLQRYPDDPRAHELAGKAQLMEGDFEAAGRHFTIARERYRDPDDVQRAADLLALSRGFEAYADGKLAAAQGEWEVIRSRELRASVLDASASSGAAGDRALARSSQPSP